MRRLFTTLAGAALALCGLAAPAAAQDAYGPKDDDVHAGVSGEFSLAATIAKRAASLLSETDSKGVGANASLNYEIEKGGTSLSAGGDVSAYNYAGTYTVSYGGDVTLSQKLGKQVKLSVNGAVSRNDYTLESSDNDQNSVRVSLAWQGKKDRVLLAATQRWRYYHDSHGGTGEGWRFSARYRHSFAPYHWVSLAMAHDQIQDAAGWHSFHRNAAQLEYSHPVAKRVRLVTKFDLREWSYPGRVVPSTTVLRRDHLFRPEMGISVGKTTGLYGRASIAYDFHSSNDPRFTGDGLRGGVIVGFRF